MTLTEQMSLVDFAVATTAEPPIGWLEDVDKYKGEMIPFRDLENYVGKRIIIGMPRQSTTDYKVVKLTSYHKDCDTIYRWGSGDSESHSTCGWINKEAVAIGKCDRVGYSDDARREKENSWVSEMYCSNGRFDTYGNYPECMYRIKEA